MGVRDFLSTAEKFLQSIVYQNSGKNAFSVLIVGLVPIKAVYFQIQCASEGSNQVLRRELG